MIGQPSSHLPHLAAELHFGGGQEFLCTGTTFTLTRISELKKSQLLPFHGASESCFLNESEYFFSFEALGK